MGNVTFSDLEISAIGEIINISLGASATAVSNMLDAKVDITTPKVSIIPTGEFDFSIIDPAVCTEISYKLGLDGKNGLLLKMEDVRVIVEMLMHTDIPKDEFELSDLYMSAICEVMNQMMGASATALSEFLNRTVDISTPHAFLIDDPDAFKESYFDGDEEIVSVSFDLSIGDRLKSEFINIMRIPLAKELVKAFIPEDTNYDISPATGATAKKEEPAPAKKKTPKEVPAKKEEPAYEDESSGGSNVMSQEEIEALLGGVSEEPTTDDKPTDNEQPVEQAVAPIQQENISMPTMSAMPPVADGDAAAQMQQMMQQMQQMQQMITKLQGSGVATGRVINAGYSGNDRMVNVHPIPTNFNSSVAKGEEHMENKELVMGVPLELSVEIGRTRKTVREILELTKGSLVVLDKLAGEQVDLFVNGQCIAKGDVVVVEDNFGIRVTEIVNKNDMGL